MLYRQNSVKILCLKAFLTTGEIDIEKSDIIFALVQYFISYNGNIGRHPNNRAISGKHANIVSGCLLLGFYRIFLIIQYL